MPITKTSGKYGFILTEYVKKNKLTNEQIFCKNSLYAKCHLKGKILQEQLIPYICSKCNLKPIWNEEPLVLHLDHINGDCFDNRISNLRFLCPNCHSQCETYSRGQYKKNNKQRKIEIINNNPNYKQRKKRT